MVPVLRDADRKSFADIEKEIGEFAEQGARRQDHLDDLTAARSPSPTAACSAR